MNFFKSMGVLAALSLGATSLGGCGDEAAESTQTAENESKEATGAVGLALQLPDDSVINQVSYNITGPNNYSRTGTVPVENSTVLAFRLGGIPVANGYSITLSSATSFGNACSGSASFNILNNATTRVSVLLVCGATDTEGDLIVDGAFQSCPVIKSAGAVPAEVRIGGQIALSSAISHGTTPVQWSGAGGDFANANAYNTTFTCRTVGPQTLTVRINAADPACTSSVGVDVVCSNSAGCGNGILDFGEVCDDGNQVNTDACTNSCTAATCGDGFVRAGTEECDDGNGVNTDACSNACQANVCGNARVDAGEACDDGNQANTDSCTNTCVAARCGDTFVQPGEACDDGNTVAGDLCTNSCQAARCGDGVVQTGVEACDDGNAAAGDGCENDCTATPSAGGDIPNQLAACRDCRQANCTAFQGAFDLVEACFRNPDPAFVQQCIDVKNCAYRNNCGYNATGAAQCFCGTVDLNTCQNAGAANGPCQAEWYAAARTTSLATLIGSFSDVSLPSGVAYYFQECDRDYCTACRP